MSDSTFATLTSHFEALALAELYGELATELMVEKLTPFYEYFDNGGGEAVAQYLRSEARGVVREYGLNHWKPVLLGALAGSELFCDGGFTALGSRDESIVDFSP
ncbi:hypothetical protein [Plantibacter sp. M259]|uniref:hypothetical protein n=1 Tax=Plantibacter sp. M259 TaxID=2583822 RepID=UPI00111026B9|nr:hypothetical protein [Plantibacter sp. M259]